MLRTMHGMLSSAVVLAAFAVIAGAGGYVAVWLYRASPGGPARSRPAREPGASGQAGQPAGADAGQPAVQADGTGWPGPAVTDGAGLDRVDEAGPAHDGDGAGQTDGTGWPGGSPMARVYVLERPRTPSR